MVGSSSSGPVGPNALNTPGAAFRYYQETERMEEQLRQLKETEDQENHDFDDHDPVKENASKQEIDDYKDAINRYCSEMLWAFRDSQLNGVLCWIEFCSIFRPHTIQAMDKIIALNRFQFLISRGVFGLRKQTQRVEPIASAYAVPLPRTICSTQYEPRTCNHCK